MASKKITLPFYFGDKVYYVANKPAPNSLGKTCPVCNGSGKFTRPTNGLVDSCPGVNGYMCVNGTMAVSYMNYAFPVCGHITDIFMDEDPDAIGYEVGSSNIFYACQLHETLEAAQAACDKRNSDKRFV